MSYGRYKFESIEQFQTAISLAEQGGYKTVEGFSVFLELFYSNLKK